MSHVMQGAVADPIVSPSDFGNPGLLGTEFYTSQLGGVFTGLSYFSTEEIEDLEFGLYDIDAGEFIDTYDLGSVDNTAVSGWVFVEWPDPIDLTIFRRYKIIMRIESGNYYQGTDVFDQVDPYVNGGLEVPALGTATQTKQGTFASGAAIALGNPTGSLGHFYYVDPEVEVSGPNDKIGGFSHIEDRATAYFVGYRSDYDRTGGGAIVFGNSLFGSGGTAVELDFGMYYSDGDSWHFIAEFHLNE